MKKIFFLLCCSLLMMNKIFAQMIVANPPQPIAPFVMFSVVSPQATPKGVLLTPMSVAQRDQITKNSAPDGLLVYNTTEQSFNVLKSGNWTVIADTNRVKTMLDLKATSLLSLINLAEQNAKAYTDTKVVYINGRIDSLKTKQTSLTNILNATNTNFNNLVTTTIPALQSQITNHTHSSITDGNITANVGSNGLKVSNLAPNQMVVTGNDGALKTEPLGNLVNGTSWGLSGNTGTDPNVNFIGTTDNQPLIFKTNNFYSGGIGSSNSSIGLGRFANMDHATNTMNMAGTANVAIGNFSLYNANGNSSVFGAGNTAVGNGALHLIGANSSFQFNSAFGAGALENAIGYTHNNIAVGVNCMQSAKGSDNTVVGFFAMNKAVGSGNIAIGYGANQDKTISNSVIIGGSGSNGTNIIQLHTGLLTSPSNTATYGNLQINTSTIHGQLLSPSDRRLKQNITENPYGLALLKDIKTYEYEYKAVPGKKRTGVMAQDLAELERKYGKLPFLYTPTDLEKENYSVSYLDLVPVSIKAIQEQQTIIETQQKKIADLEKENEARKNEMAELRKMILEMKK